MKRSVQFVDDRRSAIIALLEQYGKLKIAEIAKHFSVSALTIRRDLQYLEQMDIISRRYGEAILLNPLNTSFSSTQLQSKLAIAQKAASLVSDNDTIFLNTSSTALMLLSHLLAENVTVITNNAKAVNTEVKPDVTVIMTGGQLHQTKKSLVGDFAVHNLKQVSAQIAFIGCSGISPEAGISTSVIQEGSVNLQMIEQASRVVVLADHSKIGHIGSYRYSDLSVINTLICDESSNKNLIARFRRMGIEVIVVPEHSLKAHQRKEVYE